MKKLYSFSLKNIAYTLSTFLILLCSVQVEAQPPVTVYPTFMPCEAEPVCGFKQINKYFLAMDAHPGQYNYPGFPVGCALHDPNWFAFVAGATQVSITISIANCSGGSASLQFTIYSGDPECQESPPHVSGLDVVAGNCDCINGTQTYTFNTTPGFTYYMVFDGCAGALCEVTVTVEQGGQPPQLDNTVMPQDIQLPEFNGPDTICLGADEITICADELPEGAAYTLWILPNGDTIKSDIGSPCVTLENIFNQEGSFDVCVAAANDCDTSDYECKTYFIRDLTPIEETATICEGSDYNWPYDPSIDFTSLSPGEHEFSAFVETATGGCSREYILHITVLDENDENPTEVDTIICYPGPYFFDINPSTGESFTTTDPTENAEYVDISPITGCDTFFNMTVEMVGGLFTITDPVCATGGITFSYIFTKYASDMMDIDDPRLTVTYEWYDVSTNTLIATGQQLTLTQAQLEAYGSPDGRFDIVLRVTVDLGNGQICTFESDPYTINIEDWIPEIVSVEGPDTLCPGTSGNYLVNIDFTPFLPTDFILQVQFTEKPDGILVDEIVPNEEYKLTALPHAKAGEVCIEVMTACGFTDEYCFDIVISDVAQPDVGPDRTECAPTFTVTADPGNTGEWSYANTPSGSTVSFADVSSPSTEVTVDKYGSYTLIWTEGRPGCQKFDTLLVDYVPGPEFSSVSYNCNPAQTEYTVSFTVSGASPFTVTSGNGSVDGNGNFTSDPFASESSQTITIEDANGCVTSIDVEHTCNCDNAAGTMEQTLIELCADGVAQGTYNGDGTLDKDDTEGYILHDGSGSVMGTVYGMNKTGEFSFQAGMTYGETYYISHIIGTDDGTGVVDTLDPCLQVAIGQPVVWYAYPEADAGNDTTFCGLSDTLDGGPMPGKWEFVSGPGTATFADSSRGNTVVTVTKVGDYTFRWIASNHMCSDTSSVNVSFVGAPIQASFKIDCSPDKTEYRVIVELTGGSGSYVLQSGNGTLVDSTVTSDWTDIDVVDTLVIYDNLGCGPLMVEMVGNCDCESEVGTMDTTGILTACEQGGCVQALYDASGEYMDNNDGGLYILHTDTVGMSFGTILMSNTTGEFCFGPPLQAGVEYYISYIVGNKVGADSVDILDQCLAVTAAQEVMFYEQPEAVVMNDTTSCSTTFNISAIPSVGAGKWTIVSQPQGSGTVTIATANNAQTEVTVDGTPGQYCFQWTETNGLCSDEAQVCVSLYDSPVVDATSISRDCNSDGETYTVSFTISGGDASSYVVTGDAGQLTGGTFISDPIQKDSTYTFYISDGNGCDTIVLSDSYSCPCLTEAGQISVEDANLCEGETVQISYSGNAGSDDNDVVEYVLKDQSGTILAQNTTGEFGFDGSQMSLGEGYEVQVYVGDPSGSGVDMSDECLDSSNVVVVTWYADPVVHISASSQTITCTVQEITLDASASEPVGEVEFAWEALENGSIKAGDEDSPRPVVLSGGLYRVTVTHTLSGCTSEGEIRIDQSEDVPVPSIAPYEKLTCAREEIHLDANASTKGPSIIAIWRDPQGNVLDTAYTLTVNSTGVYTFTLSDTVNNCEITIDVPIEENREAPVAVASVSEMLDCNTRSVKISGAGSSSGTKYSYAWSTSEGHISSGAQSLEAVVDSAGIYTLEVTDTENGCTSTASVEVKENPTSLTEVNIDLSGLACVGGQLGTIRATAVDGTSPFSYRLRPGETNTSGVFSDLEPGEYALEVEDANGCIVRDTIELEAPEEFTATIDSTIRIEEGDSAVIYISSVTTILSEVRWEIEGEYSCISTGEICDSILVKPEQSQIVLVTLINEKGCVIERIVQILVVKNRDVYIPNAFSPNKDGVNDVLIIGAGPKVVGIKDMEIYDRWGERVYYLEEASFDNKLETWDGQYKGESMQPGVFMYQMDVLYDDGEVLHFNGDVTLLK